MSNDENNWFMKPIYIDILSKRLYKYKQKGFKGIFSCILTIITLSYSPFLIVFLLIFRVKKCFQNCLTLKVHNSGSNHDNHKI